MLTALVLIIHNNFRIIIRKEAYISKNHGHIINNFKTEHLQEGFNSRFVSMITKRDFIQNHPSSLTFTLFCLVVYA